MRVIFLMLSKDCFWLEVKANCEDVEQSICINVVKIERVFFLEILFCFFSIFPLSVFK